MTGPFQTLLPASSTGGTPGGQQLTDDQIAQLRQYAATLQGDKQPARHWLEGLNNMTKDVVGALQQRRANQAVQQRQSAAAGYVAGQAAPPPYAPPQTAPYAPAAPLQQPAPASPPAMAPPPYAQPNTDWSNSQPAAVGGLYNTGMQPGAQPLQTGDFAPDPSMMSTG